jgi:hypothetical protein
MVSPNDYVVMNHQNQQPVRLAYQPPASSTSLRTNQPLAASQQYFSLRTISTSHQPNEQAANSN